MSVLLLEFSFLTVFPFPSLSRFQRREGRKRREKGKVKKDVLLNLTGRCNQFLYVADCQGKKTNETRPGNLN